MVFKMLSQNAQERGSPPSYLLPLQADQFAGLPPSVSRNGLLTVSILAASEIRCPAEPRAVKAIKTNDSYGKLQGEARLMRRARDNAK